MKRVLVVDDEDSIRSLVCQILQMEGFEVDEAYDGQDCLEKVDAFHPDVMILDLMMPVLDGWGVLERLKGANRSAPAVVVLSARPDRNRALASGAVECLGKPFNFRELVSACRQAGDRCA